MLAATRLSPTRACRWWSTSTPARAAPGTLLRDALERQIDGPVRWVESVRWLHDEMDVRAVRRSRPGQRSRRAREANRAGSRRRASISGARGARGPARSARTAGRLRRSRCSDWTAGRRWSPAHRRGSARRSRGGSPSAAPASCWRRAISRSSSRVREEIVAAGGRAHALALDLARAEEIGERLKALPEDFDDDRHPGQQRRHHRRQPARPDEPRAVARRARHQPHRRLRGDHARSCVA